MAINLKGRGDMDGAGGSTGEGENDEITFQLYVLLK